MLEVSLAEKDVERIIREIARETHYSAEIVRRVWQLMVDAYDAGLQLTVVGGRPVFIGKEEVEVPHDLQEEGNELYDEVLALCDVILDRFTEAIDVPPRRLH